MIGIRRTHQGHSFVVFARTPAESCVACVTGSRPDRRCDLAVSRPDVACAGIIRTRWYGELDVDECEAHRDALRNDLSTRVEEMLP